MISATVKRKRLIKSYPKQFDIVADKFLPTAGVVVEGTAKRLAPVKGGRLRDSITSRIEGKQAIIGTNVNYAAYVEFGTRPHVITPTNKQALYWKGAAHPVKVVHHPGTRAQPFLRPAIDKNRRKLIALYKQIFKRYFGGK